MNLIGKNITKVFPGTIALNKVNVAFESGKVHALVGKNGSGKSTLLKIFAGVYTQTEGEILLDGERMTFSSPTDALKKGIATVYQELSLIPSLSVMENILINKMPSKRGWINWSEARTVVQKLLDEMHIENISPDEKVENLSIWQMQMLEIAKAVSYNPKVLFLDEPTSSLARAEVESLFQVIRELKKKNIIIIYVSHKLDELWEVCDTCTVLRDGKYIGSAELNALSHGELIKMMFGSINISRRPNDLIHSDKIVLSVNNLNRKGKFRNISFDLHQGEILGIAGMLGSGRTELLKSVFGADPFDSGQIEINGKVFTKTSIHKMKKQGLAYISEDRKQEGLILDASIGDNLCYASLDDLSNRLGIINRVKKKKYIASQIQDLQIKVTNDTLPVHSLSGGNQQKIVVGNWLNTNPSIIFFDEPSKGIDINAKQQIFKIMWEASRRGISSIMISTELEELLEVCHRILIMRHGILTGEINNPESTENDTLYTLCMGGIINENQKN